MKITLLHVIDHIKGNWRLWACEIEMPDGTIKHGSIQSDGYMHAEDTFEEED